MLISVVVLAMAASASMASPVLLGASAPQYTSVAMYLQKYGYLPTVASNPRSSGIVSEESVSRAIMDFQVFAGVEPTGQIDAATLEVMSLPRCSVKDRIGSGMEARRKKRYTIQGSKWSTKDLTYRIVKYPQNSYHEIGKEDIDDAIYNGFDIWSKYTDLTFKNVSGDEKANIEISFVSGEHGDGDPLDGPGGVLAHAYFPRYGGDAHFDEQERWTLKSSRGTNLLQVAAHEFGHSLGLSHSDIKEALMAPFYRGYNHHFDLHKDDILGIQVLYGAKSGPQPSPTPPVPTVPPTTEDDLCDKTPIDTIFTDMHGDTYVFKGDHYWQLSPDGSTVVLKARIEDGWPGLPTDIDAALSWKGYKVFFFKGMHYYRVSADHRVEPGYPKLIEEGFPGIPNNIDAVFTWSGNGKIYFFQGSWYYRFDPKNTPAVSRNYPKLIKTWRGIPNNLDAAMQFRNGKTYFFTGNEYYRFNNQLFKVEPADPPYPRSTSHWWFGCPSENSSRVRGSIAAVEDNHQYEDHNPRDATTPLDNMDVGPSTVAPESDGSEETNSEDESIKQASLKKETTSNKIDSRNMEHPHGNEVNYSRNNLNPKMAPTNTQKQSVLQKIRESSQSKLDEIVK